MDSKEHMSALEVALKNEMQEREFYLKHAERSSNPLGKAMFIQIADDELEHYERLKQLRDTLSLKGQWPQSLPLEVKDTRIGDVLKSVLEKAEKIPAGDESDLAALQTAIDFEGRGSAYYAALRDQVSDPKQKVFFDLLAGIEHEHYVSLRDTEQFLTDPASWYRTKERPGLDGG